MTPLDRAPRKAGPATKVRDAAAVLLILGVLLLVSPLISLFTRGSPPTGQFAPFLYVFGVWAGLIALAFVLSRHLSGPPETDEEQP